VPWPWYLAGTIIGLIVPTLLLIGAKSFGISANLRHLCAMGGSKLKFFSYDWRREGGWNLMFAIGLMLGGWLATHVLGAPADTVAVSASTTRDLHALGLTDLSGVAPPQLVSWSALSTLPGFLTLVVGGLLVGFGARWSGGCTSGHAVAGLAAGQVPSLLAVVGFFAGGLVMTWIVLPWIVP